MIEKVIEVLKETSLFDFRGRIVTDHLIILNSM